MINYDKTKKLFDIYIDDIIIKLKNIYLKEDECSIKKYEHQLEMVQQKYNHTMRVVENIAQISNKMNQSINFFEIAKVVGLFHDVGRFCQTLYTDTFVDKIVYKHNPLFSNHGEEGESFLINEGFNRFDISTIYQPVLSKAVGMHHLNSNEIPFIFSQNVTNDFVNITPEQFLTGSYNFNEVEQKIISLLLQMVRDIDKIDILYQRSIGEIASVPEILKVKNIGTINLLKLWGITIDDLKLLNSQDEIEHSDILKLRVIDIPIEKLFVSDNLKNKIYMGEEINLKALQETPNYSFITAIWWSIYTFLSDINFVSNLESIKDNEILERIYQRYPSKYRILIDEIFNYAKDILINETIFKNKNSIYIRKR